MSINLVTYANQTVTPTNDAIIYERAIDQNGIFHGCNVTVSGNAVNITGGYGIVCGREFVIESESIPVTLAPSGTLDGRLYVRLDLADADAPIQLLTDQGNPLPALEQDTDVNYVNGAYEMELATFTVGVSSLSDCTETFETIVGSKKGFTLENTETDYNTTALASGITIPKSGFLLMTKASASTATNYSIGIQRNGVNMPTISQATASGTIIHTCLPVMKGDVITLQAGYTGSPYVKLIAYSWV